MDGIAHISSVVSAPWIAWIMLALVGCAVFAEAAQPGVITQAHSSFFARSERTYHDSPMNFMGQLLITLFRLGTVAMMLFLCICPAAHAPFAAFSAVLGIIFAIVVLKMLSNLLLDYVFRLTRRFGTIYVPYGDLVTIISLLLYPLILILLRFGNPVAAQWVTGIVALVFLVLCIYRGVRTYLVSPMALVYLFIYIATLEVLPLAGMVYLSGKIITII